MKAVIDLFGPEGERNGHFKVETVPYARRQHSNDGIGFAIDAQRLADNVAVRAQPVPQSISQNDSLFSARDCFLRQKVASH